MKHRLTQSEKLARQTAQANHIRRKLAGIVGSPYRIQEAIANKGKPKPNSDDRRLTSHQPTPAEGE